MFEESGGRGGIGSTLLHRPITGAVLGVLFAAIGGILSVAASLSGHGVYMPWILVFMGTLW